MTTTVVNNSVFRAFFEKQRLTGPNFIDWYHSLRIVLSIEDKLPLLEQPIPAMPVPPAGQVLPPDVLATHSAWVKASKEISGLMLAEQELLQTVREFHAFMTQNLALSLILVSMRKEYNSFVQNYNMHGMGKTVTELHAMLKLHEQTLPKKDVAPALHAIRAGKVQKKNHKNKKPQLAGRGNNQGKGMSKLSYAPKPKIPPPPKKDSPAKDVSCHQCGDGLKRSRKLKPGALSLSVGDGHRAAVEAIRSYHLCLPNKLEVFETFKVFQKEVENQLRKTIKSLRSDRRGEYMSQEFLDHLKEHGIIAHRTPPYTPQHNGVSERRNRTLLDMVRSMMSQATLPKSFWDYALESTRTRRAPDHMCLYIDAEVHELGDHNEPANYKAALLDHESEKWLDAMNVEMQSMKDNEVWDLVDLHPDGKTVGSKWLFKKKNDMDRAVHTYKARLVAKGFTQTYRVDYEETFSTVADVRAIRIIVAIAAFYDYEIWQMDVKTAFLNGHLSEEVYMVKLEGFVNPKYPNQVCKLKRSI
ncbi:zinc finger, CCHC-type containing protein [Tanacetum coccineum]|uniref:Zinc finger, CCHC-type containing protein n=1 Tax=Tanacetum coccineum TaxID=301880 RepID=A0ABQ5HXY6_9ASTR